MRRLARRITEAGDAAASTLTFSITATAGAREARQIAEQVQGIGQGPIRRTHAAGAQGRLDFMRAESDPGGARAR